MTEQGHLSIADYAVESICKNGEQESGDRFVALETCRGGLFGVVDGLGHGSSAASAALRAVETIAEHADESLVTIMRACHEQLRSTRGAVLALALISPEDATITCLSVGNVEGAILRYEPGEISPYETVLMRSGVVGYNLPPLRPFQFTVAPGDLLVLSTDGIAGDYQAALAVEIRSIVNTTSRSWHTHAPMHQGGVEGSVSPEGIAQHVTRKYFKGNDDALVLVAQYHGRS